MRKSVLVLVSLFLLIFAGNILAASLPQTGQWVPSGSMSQVRSGAAAVTLPFGNVLVTGGADENGNALSSAEMLGADGTFKAVAPMNVARTGHTATWVPVTPGTTTGYVLVTGGTSANGVIVSSAELYDPTANTWTLVDSVMVNARTGHTVTALPNGAVLLAGGDGPNGALSSLETFELATGRFSFAGAISARKGHAAAALQDGRVLIVGGTDSEGNTLASTAIYDPETKTVSEGPGLITPRANASATTLLDGSVLIAGGSFAEGAATNGNIAELKSAEIYNPATGTIAQAAATLTQARASHLAFLLPNNNNVLLVGGTFGGSLLSSVEIYTPWAGAFTPGASTASVRVNATGSSTFPMFEGALLVAGGANQNSAELYGFATVKTDANDYAPGTAVMISGSGWVPGETVTLKLEEVGPNSDAPTFTTVADENGSILDGTWAPDVNDINVRFYLTAIGSKSQAQLTFTDAAPTLNVTVIGPVGSGTVSGSDGFISSCAASPTPGTLCTHQYTKNFSTTLAATALGGYTFTGWGGGCTGTGACTASGSGNGTVSITATFGSSVVTTTTSISSSPNPSTYGQSVTFTATVSPNTATGTITFKDGTTTLGTGTLSGGTASYTTAALSAATHSITAVYAGNASYATSTSPAISQVVNKRILTVTAATDTKIYDGNTSSSAVPKITSGSLVGSDTATWSQTFIDKNVGGGKTLTASGTLNDGNSGANYAVTFNSATGTITALPITVKATSDSKLYDGSTSSSAVPTISSGNLVGGDTATWLQTFDNKNVGAGKTLTPSGTVSDGNGGNNYAVTFASDVNGTITGRALTVTATASNKVYDGGVSALVTLGDDRLAGDVFSMSYTGASFADKNVGTGKAVSITGISLSGADAGNYTVNPTASATANITPATLTANAAAQNKAYDGTNTAAVSFSDNRITGDVLTIGYASATFDDKNVGSAKPVSVSGLSLSGADAGNYNLAATTATSSANITPALLTVTADSKTMPYGSSVPSLTSTITGFVGGDTVAVLSGAPSVTTTALQSSAVGSYQITAALGTLSAANYTFSFVDSTLSVTPAPLTITADDKSMTYGGAAPALTYSVSGFVNGDTKANLTAQPTLSTTTDAAGSFSITVAGASAANYTISYAPGTMLVHPATLTVTADNKTMVYGGVMPALTYSVTGYVNGETAAVFTNAPAASTAATSASAAGSYTINVSGGAATNYQLTYVPGALGVTKAPLTITPNDASRAYQSANPIFTGVISGLRNGDGVTATYTTTANASSAPGTYPITVASVSDGGTGVLSNYDVTMQAGTLTVTNTPVDLIEVGLSIAGTTGSGQPIQITETTTNQGGTDGYGSSTFFYLSTDGVTKGTLLGSRPVPRLTPGTSSTATTTLSLPFNVSGTFYLIACADGNFAVTEANETNNCIASTPFAVAPSDLTESAVSMITANPIPGGSVQVTDAVSNGGQGNAGSSYVMFYLSTDGATKGTMIGSRATGVVAAGSTSTATTSLTLPTGLAGTYYIVACADGNSAVAETNENNNCRASSSFTLGGVDLVESAVAVLTSNPVAGSPIQVSDTVLNQGSGKAASSYMFLYLSQDGTTKGASLGSRSTGTIAGGATSAGTTTVNLPVNLIGTYYIIACADGNSAVAETNESNNCKASASFTVAGADLTVTDVNMVTANPTAGGSVQISDTVLNQGAGKSGASYTFLYLSLDGVTKSTSLGSRSVVALGSGVVSAGSTTVKLPFGIKGTYYVMACADGSSAVNESSESNNCKASTSFAVQ